VYGKDVTLDCGKRDRYQREVCVVILEGQDINLAQVAAGLAMWYRQYAREQTPRQRDEYAAAEQEAKDGRRELWSDAEPTPPWEWRRSRRKN
jgi:endonuclease YncB( thermonuclease family)